MTHRAPAVLVALLIAGCGGPPGTEAPAPASADHGYRPGPTPQRGVELAGQVEIRRTAYGVPHITGENLAAAAFGLAYVQLEDYGAEVTRRIMRATGVWGRHMGWDSIGGDFGGRQRHRRAVETYHLLEADTRAVLEGFAAGLNYFIEVRGDELPEWARQTFTAHDVATSDVGGPNSGLVRRFLQQMEESRPTEGAAQPGEGSTQLAEGSTQPGEGPAVDWRDFPDWDVDSHPDDGSNAWAFAPSRTASGNAILLRNPHLAWDAGYYEAHVTVPGDYSFYGDYRIGGPFTIIGGFSEYVGWATTNNGPDMDEIYALDADPARPGQYLFDGASVPLTSEEITVDYKDGDGFGFETRTVWHTAIGPVIYQSEETIYVIRTGSDGVYLRGQQWLRMLRARNLEDFQDAMRMRAISGSNYTYADRDGNIYLLWNAMIPDLPHEAGTTEAIPASRSSEIWTRLLPFERLPQLLNPEGGYVLNSNDPPYYTNLNAVMDPDTFPSNFPDPRLGLRSQLSHDLATAREAMTLEDVVELKHSLRMLLAERVKEDLIAAVRDANPDEEVSAAIDLIERWDNTAAIESRGGVLFKMWARMYRSEVESEQEYRVAWDPEQPATTPAGLGAPEAAATAFALAVEATRERFGAWDVPWGEAHRIRAGEIDLPVGGCTGELGCFRVLGYRDTEDGKFSVRRGDGWVIAVEFGDPPRAYSVLVYGESPDPDSPYFYDQAELFSRNEMKRVAFTEEEIESQTVGRYRPGRERR